jgi:transaldolase
MKNKIDIYYDGSDYIQEYIKTADGVTTNIGFLKKSNITDYEAFIKETVKLNNQNKPVSFQVFGETLEECRSQALKISSFGEEVFVKIPVVGPHGEDFTSLVREMVLDAKLNINTTCVYTKDQIDDLDFLNMTDKKTIVSIFCGRIGDTGADPFDIVNYAVSKFRNNDNVKILWAGCQRVLDILHAEKSGCDIITVPKGVYDKMNRIGVSLHDFSVKTSYDFHMDGSQLILK